MIALSMGSTGFSEWLALIALIVLVFGTLESERIWTRGRRRRGLEPGAAALLLDGLVIIGIVLVFADLATLLVQGLTSVAATVGGVINGERVGLLIVGMALALGLALVLARVASGRRAAQNLSTANAAATLPANAGPIAADARQGSPVEQQVAYAQPPDDQFEEQPPALAMMQERWQPGGPAAASVPTSFLDLKDSQTSAPARSRFALVSTLLMLALVVMAVSSAVLFRHQLITMLAGMEASYGDPVATGTSVSSGPPDGGAESAAANVASAAAPAASAPVPTATNPPAQLPAGDTQGAQKRVKSNGLNLRALPGTDQQVVAVLRQGDIVTVFTDARLIQGATWVKVRAGDSEGWVDQSLLE
jgi:hypothetical protein